MATPRIYQEEQITSGRRITLTKEASHHVAVVLRMHPGENLILFCGDNQEFYATIVSTHKNLVVVDVTAVKSVNRELEREIHLGQGLSKGERFEWVIQKAIELGVSSITPLLSMRCVVRINASRMEKKLAQWQAVAIAACEQSGRNKVPVVNAAMSFIDFLQYTPLENQFIMHPTANKSISDVKLAVGPISLIIGPEGGFCEEEIKHAKTHDFSPINFGPRILRTETAAIAALSVLATLG